MGRGRARSQSPPSRARELEVVEQALDEYAVIQLDREGRIIRWDASAEQIFGYSESEVKGKSISSLYPDEERDAVVEQLQRAVRNGMTGAQRWYVRKDRSRCWVSGTVRVVKDQRGEAESFFEIVRDFTQQKLQELRREALLNHERSARVEAEKRWKGLEEIVENIPALIALIRLPEQSYVLANRGLREFSRVDLVGRTLREAHPEVGQEFFETVDRVASTGRAFAAKEWQVPLQAVHDSAKGPYFDVLLQPVHSEDGRSAALLLFASDVTHEVRARHDAERLAAILTIKRERLEAEIRERKEAERLAMEQAALLDLAQDSIVALTPDRIIVFWNHGAEQEYGWKKEEAIGRRMHELLRTQFPAPFDELFRELLARGEWSGEVKHTRRDGRCIEDLSRWVLRRQPGMPDLVLQVDRDITERKRMEERLRESQKLESLGILAGGIAHDFNNLLTSILGNISFARDSAATREEIDEFLARAEEAGQFAAGLVRQMLAFTGKGQLLVGPVDLSEVARNAFSLVRGSARYEIEFGLDLADDLPAIRADSTQLQQVAMNLLLNAAEAIAGPGKVLVRTCVSEIDSETAGLSCDVGRLQPGLDVVLEVQDSGTGIEQDVRPRIFDPFFTTKFPGRGMGLAAVAGIVRLLGGAIRISSQPGAGTTFTVLLPTCPGEEAAE